MVVLLAQPQRQCCGKIVGTFTTWQGIGNLSIPVVAGPACRQSPNCELQVPAYPVRTGTLPSSPGRRPAQAKGACWCCSSFSRSAGVVSSSTGVDPVIGAGRMVRSSVVGFHCRRGNLQIIRLKMVDFGFNCLLTLVFYAPFILLEVYY